MSNNFDCADFDKLAMALCDAVEPYIVAGADPFKVMAAFGPVLSCIVAHMPKHDRLIRQGFDNMVREIMAGADKLRDAPPLRQRRHQAARGSDYRHAHRSESHGR